MKVIILKNLKNRNPLPNIRTYLQGLFKTTLFKNSLWGVISNVLQNVLFSVFFIVLARQYAKDDFANYVIANTVYGFILGFSSLGLGHWFIRELVNTENKKELTDKFFKIQLYSGFLFYLVNIIMAFSLYESSLVRNLSVLIGINIIFDNIINVIKYINIAKLEQRKSFMVLTIEAFLKFLLACVLFIYPIHILYLSFFLIVLRLITLNLFLRIGSSQDVSLQRILSVRIPFREVMKLVAANWSFIIIGSISVIYWRIGSIQVSKVLTLSDVANYEISFKLFSIAYLLPVIVASTVYPMLLNAHKQGLAEMKKVYHRAFLGFMIYGLCSYMFVYSFADDLVPWLFGDKYAGTPQYCKEMFLSILIFPTLFLQANVLITMKLEKLDMLCNIVSLVLNVTLCAVGFYYMKSLSVVNYAIFLSFLAFHFIQDVVLIRKKVSGLPEVLGYYGISAILLFGYQYLCTIIQKEYLFFIFWAILALAGLIFYLNWRKRTARAAI